MTDPDFDLDRFIDDMAQSMAEKHPRPHRGPLGLARHLLEANILRRSRDQQARETIDRRVAPPMHYDTEVERRAVEIILPPGAKR